MNDAQFEAGAITSFKGFSLVVFISDKKSVCLFFDKIILASGLLHIHGKDNPSPKHKYLL